MPVHRVRTRTSSGPGSGSDAGRISPTPGDSTQKARTSGVIRPPPRPLVWSRTNRILALGVSIDCVLLHDHGGTVPTVRSGPLGGLIAQIAFLAALEVGVGLA